MTSSHYGCGFASSYIPSQLQGSVLYGDCTDFQGGSEAIHMKLGGVVSDVKWSSFYKNNNFFTQILPENVKIYCILEFYLIFTVVGFTHTHNPTPLSLRPY